MQMIKDVEMERIAPLLPLISRTLALLAKHAAKKTRTALRPHVELQL
jgi:hypothetical protein